MLAVAEWSAPTEAQPSISRPVGIGLKRGLSLTVPESDGLQGRDARAARRCRQVHIRATALGAPLSLSGHFLRFTNPRYTLYSLCVRLACQASRRTNKPTRGGNISYAESQTLDRSGQTRTCRRCRRQGCRAISTRYQNGSFPNGQSRTTRILFEGHGWRPSPVYSQQSRQSCSPGASGCGRRSKAEALDSMMSSSV